MFHPNTQDDNHMYEETILVKEGTHGTAPVQKGLYQALAWTRRNLESHMGMQGLHQVKQSSVGVSICMECQRQQEQLLLLQK